jgi:hypothetical protein
VTDIGYLRELESIPEPMSLTLVGAGVLLLCGVRRWKA